MSLSVTSTAINFDNIHRAVQQVTVTGGLPPYSASSSNTNVATVAQATSPNLWSDSDTLTSSTLSGLTLASGGPNGATDAEATGNGSPIGSNAILDRVVPVVMGQTYTPSFFIDPSQITNNNGSTPNIGSEFSGATQNADGSWSNVDGKSSATKYTLTSGVSFTVGAGVLRGTLAGHIRLIIGNKTNGYSLLVEGTDGKAFVQKYVAGSLQAVSPGNFASSIGLDGAYHSYSITVTPGSPNTILVTCDSTTYSVTDSSLTLSSGTWPISLDTGGSTGNVKNYGINCQVLIGLNTADGLTQILQQYVALNTTTAGRYATSAWTCPTNLVPNSDSMANSSLSLFAPGTGGPNGATDYEIVGTGTNITSNAEWRSQAFAVTAGEVIAPSFWVDPSQVTNGTPEVHVVNAANGSVLGYLSVTGWSVGAAAQRYACGSYTIPAGVTSVCLSFFAWNGQSGGFVIANGQKFKLSQPMLESKSSASGYYISSQNPQVQVFAQLLSSAIVTSGQKFKISQPMLALSTYDPNTYLSQTAVWNITPKNGGAATITYTDSTP